MTMQVRMRNDHLPQCLPQALLAALCMAAAGAQATTFTVTHAGDPGDPACTPGACSLRAAILAANVAPGADTIVFDIPGAGVQRIELASALPTLQPPLTIDGYTQPGAAANTLTAQQGANNAQIRIHLSGSVNAVTTGFGAFSGPLLLRGLSLTGFTGSYLDFNAPANSTQVYTVEGCYLGVAPDGTPASPPAIDAIRTFALTQIGGIAPAARNVVTGATRYLLSANNPRVVVEGNLFGVLPSGMALPPSAARPETALNIVAGVSPSPAVFQDHRIGGAAPGARNVIGGARSFGISMFCQNQAETCFDGATIQGNAIGVDAAGTTPLPNGSTGGGALSLFLPFANQRVTVGGVAAGEGNLIAFNQGFGVQIDTRNDARVAVLGNEIRGNTGLPIQFAQSGLLLPNDAGDPDNGSNRLQNWPQLLSVTRTMSTTEVSYRVDSSPASSAYPLRVEFFLAFGNGAEIFLDSDTIAAEQAQAVRVKSLPFVLFEALVATATDADGRTSQLSPPFPDAVFANGFE